jgi:hypothetical protein
MEQPKNNIQWASIPLLIPFMLNTYLFPRPKLASILFETPAQATQKYDGTNVGKDERGVMYGRTLQIAESVGAYQKTSLDDVKKLDANAVKRAICERAKLEPTLIDCFCLYGELMCNKSLYNYAAEKLGNTHQLFGAMIRPANGDLKTLQEILSKLTQAGFACMRRGNDEEGEKEEGGSETTNTNTNTNSEPTNATEKTSDLVMLFMNRTLSQLLQEHVLLSQHKCATVPLVGRYDSLAELIGANFEWMVNGRGEGLVIVLPAPSEQQQSQAQEPHSSVFSGVQVAKWKIGSEASANNVSLLRGIIEELEADLAGDKSAFGPTMDHAKALELFKQMLEVANSKKVCTEML